MQRILPLFFLFFLSIFVVFGQGGLTIQYLEKPVEAENVIKTAKFKKRYKNTASVERDLQKLILRLQRYGFDAASLDTVFMEENTYIASVYVGNKLIINQIRVDGMEKEEIQSMKIKPDIFKQTDFSLNTIFSYNEQIVNKLWNTGYPFAATKISDLTPNDSGYTASISIEKNNYIVLDSIILAGNLKLGKSFLYGYLGLKRRKPYNESAMKQVPSRLQELVFADMLQPPGVSFSEKEAALYIFANKQKINQFDGYMGIVPND